LRIRVYNLIVLALVLFAAVLAAETPTDSEANREYQIKAAFLYNFIKFVDWPNETSASDKPIIIGIIGKNPFGTAFEPMKDKPAKDRKVIVKWFTGLDELKTDKHPQIEDIRGCNLLFVCSSEKEKLKETLDLVKDRSILTVADMQGFLETGGIVNFILEENKVGFEINVAAAKQAKLEIRSNLLRLARRIVEGNSAKKT
jgi:YfiR/HmsC-like